ncbi:MAG: hypothetical protein V3T22_12950 [Planctomycetota bacterium]
MHPQRRDIFLYLVLPAVVGAALLAMFFSGVGWLQSLVVPVVNREYGLLENLQNLLLLALIVVGWRAARRTQRGLDRAGWRALAVFALFVLLEEIDFGLHYYESLAGVPGAERATLRNFHNQEGVLRWMKLGVDSTLALFFVALPWAGRRIQHPTVRWSMPSRWLTATLSLSLLVSRVAHYGTDHGWPTNGTIESNVSEFRELFTYYIFLLYLFDLGLRRPPRPGKDPR